MLAHKRTGPVSGRKNCENVFWSYGTRQEDGREVVEPGPPLTIMDRETLFLASSWIVSRYFGEMSPS